MARFKLHNGKEIEVPDEFLPDLEEMGKGYLRQDDYTRKRQSETQQLQQMHAQIQQLQEAAQQAQAWGQWWEQGGGKQMYEKYNQNNDDGLETDDFRAYFDQNFDSRYQKAQQEIQGYLQQSLQPILQEIQRTQTWARHIDNMNRLYFQHHGETLKDEPFRYDDLQKVAYERGRNDLTYDDWKGYYSDIYREPLMKREVERRGKEEAEAKSEKDKAASVSGKTGTALGGIFTTPSEAPASRDDANSKALDFLKSERVKRGE